MVAIRDLAPEVIAQIAAGEMVTRAGDVSLRPAEHGVDGVLD
jgi:hypothetical protein